MVLLNHFRSLLIYSTFILPLQAGVVEFFDPNRVDTSYTLQSNLSYFIASDPISLDGMFHDWDGEYHPKSLTNIAMQDMRFDIGSGIFDDYYVGYFYRYNVYIETGKDFTDFFYRIKNHIDLDPSRRYELNLNIEGIEQSGLILSHSKMVFDNGNERIKLGGALSFTVGHEMQHGSIDGQARVPNKKSYEASGEISSYYTHNYLYDLDVTKATAYGYGSDFAIEYKNRDYGLEADFIVNDLWSKMYWRDLPYSQVHIDTKNKSYDEDGYAHYSPSIKGKELYVDFTQNIEPRYRVEVAKELEKDRTMTVGSDYLYHALLPYVQLSQSLSNQQNIALSYEHRFGSIGLDYSYKALSFGLATDGIKDASTFGIRANYLYQF